ncbi:hypothetical protein BK138_00095 [Paenibacillus rhizosphaerae]|uniref:Ferric oxidoreductase domain-containing protein n=1 Tax=Paenibacillus rhizosphaerae TaxID=297318 RepID=A0A1R1EZ69_9BACL|nr:MULTISPECIES: hypothetical protein [Paenibacillus]OMF57072.1 hypothetical protein BK138_00095 [Paenibacillus rhizosphaerae]UYO02205.1 hypothetical protein K2F33_20810 [Paenibacillus sp. PSB04]
MKTKKVWIPAIIAAVAAVLLLAYYFYTSSFHSNGDHLLTSPEERALSVHSHGEERPEGGAEIFKFLGTLAVFLGAASFSWVWFKKKMKSPSVLVRKTGKCLYGVHKLLGWITLTIVTAHGLYFLITKPDDHKIFTGLSAFTILLMIAGYGFFIKRIRNKRMRVVHRYLGILWAPLLLLHAGGSAIVAIIATLAVWAVIRMLERMPRSSS